MPGTEGKIYLELDAYELGQLVALMPINAYKNMDESLRKKIYNARKEIEADRERARLRAAGLSELSADVRDTNALDIDAREDEADV